MNAWAVFTIRPTNICNLRLLRQRLNLSSVLCILLLFLVELNPIVDWSANDDQTNKAAADDHNENPIVVGIIRRVGCLFECGHGVGLLDVFSDLLFERCQNIGINRTRIVFRQTWHISRYLIVTIVTDTSICRKADIKLLGFITREILPQSVGPILLIMQVTCYLVSAVIDHSGHTLVHDYGRQVLRLSVVYPVIDDRIGSLGAWGLKLIVQLPVVLRLIIRKLWVKRHSFQL